MTRNTKRRGLLAGEEATWKIAELTHPEEAAKREMIKSVMPREKFLLERGEDGWAG